MTKNRKTFAAREKDLRLAFLRIKRGRSTTGGDTLSIASVAREAGVSPALIYNHYPAIADAIRLELARHSSKRRNRVHEKLKNERERGRVLRAEITALRTQVARLATLNEVLRVENESLREKRADTVTRLSSSRAIPQILPNKRPTTLLEVAASAPSDSVNSRSLPPR